MLWLGYRFCSMSFCLFVSLRSCSAPISSGLVWSGLVWSGLLLSALVWSDVVWSGLVWSSRNLEEDDG